MTGTLRRTAILTALALIVGVFIGAGFRPNAQAQTTNPGWELVTSHLVTADTTKVTLTGLNGDADGLWKLYINMPLSGNPNEIKEPALRYNGDAGPNYQQQTLELSGDTVNINSYRRNGWTAATVGGSIMETLPQGIEVTIYPTSGRPRLALSSYTGLGTTAAAIMLDLNSTVWENSTDNITSLTILGGINSPNSIGAGTQIFLFRPTAGAPQPGPTPTPGPTSTPQPTPTPTSTPTPGPTSTPQPTPTSTPTPPPPAMGLIAHWKFDEGAGSTASDSAGANHGALTNMDPATDWVPGKLGAALDFDGTNDHVNVGNQPLFNFGTGDFTAAGWIKTNGTGEERGIIAKRPACNFGNFWNVSLTPAGRLRFEVNQSSSANYTQAMSSQSVNDNAWRHFTAVRQGAALFLYVDGVLSGSTTGSTTVNFGNAASLTIGQNPCGDFTGQIDDMRVYDRALSDTEALNLAQTSMSPGLGPVAGPYPASAVIETITWDWSTLSQAAPGSDLWPVTWADDGNLYTSWGDGGGFGGSDSVGLVAMGVARLEGPPQSYLGVNVNGGQNPQHLATFPNSGKTLGLLSVNGVLYSWVNTQNSSVPDFKLAWSADHGATWQLSTWSFASSAFALSTFLNFGQDYAGARDGFVYFYGGEWGNSSKDLYLGRVPEGQINDLNAYEYFAGLDASGNPTWNPDLGSQRPVFTDANSSENNGAMKAQVIFNPGVNRYLLTIFHGGPGKLGVFDGPEPWGPWTTVVYVDDFGGMTSGGEGLSSSFPTKWMSADGLTMWNVFSMWGSGAQQGISGHDRFNLVKTTLTLKGGVP